MILHLYFNYKAVTCLTFDTLNDSRMTLVLKEYCMNNSLNLAFINGKESVILGLGENGTYRYLLQNRSFSIIVVFSDISIVPTLHSINPRPKR